MANMSKMRGMMRKAKNSLNEAKSRASIVDGKYKSGIRKLKRKAAAGAMSAKSASRGARRVAKGANQAMTRLSNQYRGTMNRAARKMQRSK